MTVALPRAEELGRIVAANGYSYQIKPDDVRWLALAVSREGGDHQATIWTYFQRQVLYRRSGSLASLVQAHSQTINPEWATGGRYCSPGGRYYGEPMCSSELLARRDANIRRPWEEIPAAVRQKVVDAVQGKLPNNVPRSTDFADQVVGGNFLRRHRDSRLVLDRGNIYIAEGGAVGWPDGFVRIEYAGRASLELPAPGMPGWVGPVVGLGALAAFGAGAWFLLRLREA